MKRSESIAELATALAKAQGEIRGAEKDRTNPHFNSGYATLASVWDACRAPLSKNGLSVVQTPATTGDGSVRVTTTLLHSSGQWIEDEVVLRPRDASPQSLGSAVTYGRRYSLMGMVGVAPDDDDDGNAASGGGKGRPVSNRSAQEPVKPKAPTSTAPQSEAKEDTRIAKDPGISGRALFLKTLCEDKKRTNQWTPKQVAELMHHRYRKAKADELTDEEWSDLRDTVGTKTVTQSYEEAEGSFATQGAF